MAKNRYFLSHMEAISRCESLFRKDIIPAGRNLDSLWAVLTEQW